MSRVFLLPKRKVPGYEVVIWILLNFLIFVASHYMACNYHILKICPVLSCPLLRAVTISCRPIGRRPTDDGNKPKLITVSKFSHDLHCLHATTLWRWPYIYILRCWLAAFRLFDTNCRQVISSSSNNFFLSRKITLWVYSQHFLI
jgi:hypothetical protein